MGIRGGSARKQARPTQCLFACLFFAFVMGLTRVFYLLCWFFCFAVLCTGLLSLEDSGLQDVFH